MRLTSPVALLLLLLIPAFAVLGWPARGFGKRREILSLGIRLIIVFCLVLSIAGLEFLRNTDELAVVFLIDASDSMTPDSQTQAVDYVRQAMSAMQTGDQTAVIVFGGDALVERLMSSSNQLGAITSIPQSSQTDLSAAIRLALALYPPGAARRMVLLSDGNATEGDAEAAARLAAASGVQIMAIPFESASSPEALITSVNVPARLRLGEQFDLQLELQATQSMEAELRILVWNKLIYQGEHELKKGVQSLSLPLTTGTAGIDETGFVRFEVQIVPQQDGFYQNNELGAFTQVEGPPKVLLVAPPADEILPFNQEPRPDEAAQLVKALKATNFDIQTVSPSGLPSDLSELAPFAALVLVDVPGSDLSDRQMLALQTYVRDLGGGLLTIGGPTSYGVGGYFHTPLEETLPVEMQIKDAQRRPSLTMVFIIDRSGSMSETSGGVSKLELAKEAAIRSTEMLFPADRVGVITFDENASWVVAPTTLSDPGSVIRAIGSIRAGGGTDILAGLQLMAKTLPDDPANLKHVILLTDGGADPTGIPQLVERLYRENGITLSTVGVGQDAAAFLPDLARRAGGRYHFAADPGTIPRIFSEETSLAARAYIIERTFTPRQASASPILTGIQSLPQLYGFVGTTAKSTAQTILVSDDNEPILAAWQYGLGKAVAFTSDASGHWGRDWINWQGFPRFWAQALSYTTGEQSLSGVDVHVEEPGVGSTSSSNNALLVADAQTGDGEYLNDYHMQAHLISPDGNSRTLTLTQVAPGRYQAPFIPDEQGAYLLRITGDPGSMNSEPSSTPAVASTAGWVNSYSTEYRSLEPNPKLLEQVAAITGGSILNSQGAEVFKHDLPSGLATRPIWPWLLSLAALLLPLDIAVRRLVFSPVELKETLVQMLEKLRNRDQIPKQARTLRMNALLRAKGRATGSKEVVDPGKLISENAIPHQANRRTVRGDSPVGESGKKDGTSSINTDTASSSAGDKGSREDRSSTAASLLAAKRKKHKRD